MGWITKIKNQKRLGLFYEWLLQAAKLGSNKGKELQCALECYTHVPVESFLHEGASCHQATVVHAGWCRSIFETEV